MTRNGKIARLPHTIREQINRRLADGQSGRAIIRWLNALPEVQTSLASSFEGRPINLTNLFEWKEGGYREWSLRQEAIREVADLASAAHDLDHASGNRLADHLSTVLIARYATEFSAWSGEDDPKLATRLGLLRGFCQDIAELRRGEQESARIRIEETRLEREREKIESDILLYFRRWAAFPKIREALASGDKLPDGTDPLLSIFDGKNPAEIAPPSSPASQGV
jgi:hypothetical protein